MWIKAEQLELKYVALRADGNLRRQLNLNSLVCFGRSAKNIIKALSCTSFISDNSSTSL